MSPAWSPLTQSLQLNPGFPCHLPPAGKLTAQHGSELLRRCRCRLEQHAAHARAELGSADGLIEIGSEPARELLREAGWGKKRLPRRGVEAGKAGLRDRRQVWLQG